MDMKIWINLYLAKLVLIGVHTLKSKRWWFSSKRESMEANNGYEDSEVENPQASMNQVMAIKHFANNSRKYVYYI